MYPAPELESGLGERQIVKAASVGGLFHFDEPRPRGSVMASR
jgi:hypothetical protein